MGTHKKRKPRELAGTGAASWNVYSDSDHTVDPQLRLVPLTGQVTDALAAELNRSGHGNTCGECEKPFTLTRKQRGVARVSHVDPSGYLFTTAWILCGTCLGRMKRDGDKVSPKLLAQARAAAEDGHLLVTPAKGVA